MVTKEVPKILAHLVYAGLWSARARAVAIVSSAPVGFGVITLDPTNCSSLDMNSNARLSVSRHGAPYANIVIWQDRVAQQPLQFNSNAFTATGALYAKSADVQYNSYANVPLQFVVANVQLNSNARIIVDVTGMSTAGTPSLRLTE